MRILHFIPSLNKGGAERLALDTCIALQEQGHEVLLLVLSSVNHYSFLSKQLNYKVISTQIQLSLWKKNKVNVEELQQEIDKFNPDIIHSHLFEAEINLAFCKVPIHCKRVVHFHDNMKQMQAFSLQTFLVKEQLTNYYERNLVLKNLKENTVFIGISKDTKSYIQQVLPKKYQRIQYLLNAIDLERFVPKRETKRSNKLIMTGRFDNNKSQILAIETVRGLLKRDIKISLILIGDGLLRQELINKVNEWGLQDNIEFKGFVDHPEFFLQEAIIYIHTAKFEALGLALIEAMACGLPVVCTDGKGNRDLIIEGENGFMAMERSADLLANKIQYLLENEEVRKEMGQNALEFSKQFGIKKYVKELLKLYSD